jgi:predicted ferric reductase
MTAANQQATSAAHAAAGRPATPSRSHPAVTGRIVLLVVILINLVIVEAMWVTAPVAKNTLVAIGQWLGLHAALIMIFQLVMVARLPWLDRRLGMDKLTSLHRWTGLTLFWVVLLHPTFVMLGYAEHDNAPFTKEFTNLAKMMPTLLGMFAAGVVVIAAGLSIRFARKRLPYELWHTIHMFLYVAVALALIHQAYEGSTFKQNLFTTAYWWVLWTVAIVALLVGRVIVPLIRNARHQFRVAAVVPESPDVTSVYVTGRDLHKLRAQAGQFMIWRFLTPGRWWQANPFSLSAAPDGRHLRLTAKAVGRTSSGLRTLPIGARVYIEGPYGALTSLHRTKPGTLLIAGGVGITPIRALLEELGQGVVLLYRVHAMTDAVLLEELKKLARARGAILHVLTGRTGAGNPPNIPFAPQNLAHFVPDIAHRDVFICGPAAMTDAVVVSLKQLGVPRTQIHAEKFALAGG